MGLAVKITKDLVLADTVFLTETPRIHLDA